MLGPSSVFASTGVRRSPQRRMLKLTYEELAESTDAVVHRVLAHLGIPAPEGLVVQARLSVQADEDSEEWVRRVDEHLRALEAPEPV